jgi:hypothetical protein
VVRRLSGGGALIHDRELTYSLCLPASHPLARESMMLYEHVHEALIEVLAERGIVASLHGRLASASPHTEQAAEPFLCFARRTAADVVLATPPATPPNKIVGSAQRRRRGAALQHGAVLLETSPQAPELPGLDRSNAAHLSADDVVAPWSDRLAARLNLQFEHADYTAKSALHSCKNHYRKHMSATWLARR